MSDQVLKILEQYGEKDRSNVWAIQGNTIVKHAALERVAAKAGIKFLPPSILRAEQEEAVILVTGQLGERTEWSIGEALVNVNYRVSGKQAAYVYAMAEKRGKDRVILKLVGLHGLAYSEDEADDFKPAAQTEPAPAAQQPKATVPVTLLPPEIEPSNEAQKLVAKALTQALKKADSVEDLKVWWTDEKTQGALKSLPEVLRIELIEAKTLHLEKLKERVTA